MIGAAFCAGALTSGCIVPPGFDAAAHGEDGRSLDGIARENGRLFGAAVGPLIETTPVYGRLIAANCGVIVPEYEMKWRHVAPTPDAYDFTAVDRRLAFAT